MKTLEKISGWIARKTGPLSIIVAAAVLAATLVAMEVSPIGKEKLKAASGGIGMLDMRFGYSAETVNGMFGALGAEGRLLYIRLLAVDVIFALAFMAFLSLTLSALIRRSGVPAPLMRLNLLPVLRSAFDLIENAMLVALLALYPGDGGPESIRSLAPLASAITGAKWIVFYAIIASICVFGALSIMRRKEWKR